MPALRVLGEIIFPVFAVIFIGYALKARGLITTAFVRPANRIVYTIAIPAMLLGKIARAPFQESFHAGAVLALLGAIGITALSAAVLTRPLRVSPGRRGTFQQSCFHGNIGYIAYAMAYYALGEEAFAVTAILSSFVIVAQNGLAILVLAGNRPREERGDRLKQLAGAIVANPVILAVVAGTLLSLGNVPLGAPLGQLFKILSGMALPTALMLIGATLSFGSVRETAREVAAAGLLKLVALPAAGYVLMIALRVPETFLVPGLVLLAAPPATVLYIMAGEMGGDPRLAATSISVHTLLAAVTYTLLLSVFSQSG